MTRADRRAPARPTSRSTSCCSSRSPPCCGRRRCRAAAAGTLVRERLGAADDAFIQTCHRTTSGNPLLLRQLVRALESEGVPPDVVHADTVRAVGSRAVSSLVMLRLRRMPPAAVEAARAVALIGPGRRPAGDRGTGPAARGTRGRGAGPVEPQRDPGRHPAAAVRPSAGAGRRVRRPVDRRVRAAARAGGAGSCRRAAHRPNGSPPTCCRRPLRGDAATVAILRAAAGAAADRGASDSAVTFLRRALAGAARRAADRVGGADRARAGRGAGRR